MPINLPSLLALGIAYGLVHSSAGDGPLFSWIARIMVAAKRITDEQILTALRQSRGRRAGVAQTLRISPRTLARRLDSMAPIDWAKEDDDLEDPKKPSDHEILQAALAGKMWAMQHVLVHAAGWGADFQPMRRIDVLFD